MRFAHKGCCENAVLKAIDRERLDGLHIDRSDEQMVRYFITKAIANESESNHF